MLRAARLLADARFTQPSVQALARYAQALGHLSYGVTTFSNLLGRFGLELVRVSLACHRSSGLKNTISDV